MQCTHTNLSIIKNLFTTIVITIIFFSTSAHAGCSETQGVGWVADAETGGMLENLGTGTVTECGNISGAFGGFQKGNFYAGYAKCLRDCEAGFKPGVTYVKIGEKWAPGKSTPGENATCVQQKGANRKYCWNG